MLPTINNGQVWYGCSMHFISNWNDNIWLMCDESTNSVHETVVPLLQSYLLVYYILYFIKISFFFLFMHNNYHSLFFFFFGPLEMKRINKKIILLNLPQLVYLHKHYNKISFCITSSWYDVCDFLDSLGFTLFYMS